VSFRAPLITLHYPAAARERMRKPRRHCELKPFAQGASFAAPITFTYIRKNL
jgi:hypothetical protein